MSKPVHANQLDLAWLAINNIEKKRNGCALAQHLSSHWTVHHRERCVGSYAAGVLATVDADVAVLPPFRSPRVAYYPIRNILALDYIHAESNCLDRVVLLRVCAVVPLVGNGSVSQNSMHVSACQWIEAKC